MKDTNTINYKWTLKKSRVYVELITSGKDKTSKILDLIKDGYIVERTKPINK